MRMQQSLSGVRSISLQGVHDRIAEDGRERRSRGLERSLLCADLHSITIGLRLSIVIETSTCGADRET